MSTSTGSLVGGVSFELCFPSEETELAAADDGSTRWSVFLDSGVTGVATLGGRDAVFGVGLGFSAEPFENQPIRLFCFMFSVDGFALGAMVDVVRASAVVLVWQRLEGPEWLCTPGAHLSCTYPSCFDLIPRSAAPSRHSMVCSSRDYLDPRYNISAGSARGDTLHRCITRSRWGDIRGKAVHLMNLAQECECVPADLRALIAVVFDALRPCFRLFSILVVCTRIFVMHSSI